jgi:DNA-binding Lrp family transcriptional regulator
VTDEADFVLQVVTKDLDAIVQFAMNRIRRLPDIRSTNTTIVLRKSNGQALPPWA